MGAVAEDRVARQARWVAAAAFLLLLPGAFFGLPNKPMAGAWRVLQGEVIYRDFWTIYAPGSYYAGAGLCALFGKHVLVPAVVGVALRAVAVGCFFAVLRELGGGRRLAVWLSLLVTLALWEITPELGTYCGVLAPGMGAVLLAVLFLGGGRPRRLLWAGLLLGLGATFKHDVAAYLTLAIAVAVLVSGRPWPERRAAVVRLGVGSAAVIGPVIALLAWKACADAWQDLIVFPLGDFRIVRAERFPGLVPDLKFVRAWMAEPGNLTHARDAGVQASRWFLTRGPELAFAGAVVFLIRRRGTLPRETRAAAVLALCAMPCFWTAAHVQQNTHLLSMAIQSLLLGTIVWTRAPAWRRYCGLVLAMLVAGMLVKPVQQVWLPLRVWSGWATLDLPPTVGVFVSPREAQYYGRIKQFIDDNVPPGEAIHAGVAHNDSIVVNNSRFYYLMDRPAATRYHELHPGITDREPVQREMIADLERRNVRCIVSWRFGQSPAAAAAVIARRAAEIPDAGSTLLDEWVAERFEKVFSVDEYDVLWRRDAGEPVVR